MVNSNSIETHQLNIQFNVYSEQESKILDAYNVLKEACSKQIAEYLSVSHHTISGRFSSLRKKGAIEFVKKITINNRPHSVYKIKNT